MMEKRLAQESGQYHLRFIAFCCSPNIVCKSNNVGCDRAYGHPVLADWVTSFMLARLAAGKGRHVYIPIKMASGVQDITCV